MAHGGLIHRLKGYERMLSKTRFLAGDELTVVDMFHIPFGEAMIQVRIASLHQFMTPEQAYLGPLLVTTLSNLISS